MVFTDAQFVADVLASPSLHENELPYLYVPPAYAPLPTDDILHFVDALPVGSIVFVPEESDEVTFCKTELGWVPSY